MAKAAKKSRFKIDNKKLTALFGKVNLQVYKWYGADVKQKAERSLKKPAKKERGKHISLPGQPPISQTGTLKGSIRYEIDEMRGVVIGPEKYNWGNGAPKVLEYGGKSTNKFKSKKKPTKIAARPFMKPAQEKVNKTLPDKYRRAREKYWK